MKINLTQKIESIGQTMVQYLERLGFAMRLFWDSFYWLIVGRKYKQRLRFTQVVKHIKSDGVDALPIVLALALVVGMMLAIQLIYALQAF